MVDRAVSAAHLRRLLGCWRTQAPDYHSLAAGVRGLALDGRLPLATRLPSERALAAALGLSRTTATAAYDVLRREGRLRSQHGAGSWTSLPPGTAAARSRPLAGPGALDLSVAALPAPPELAAAALEAAAELPRHLGGHGYDPLGLDALRGRIAGGYAARGLATQLGQVLVTSGALHGLDLVLRLLCSPGDVVLVEAPTYPGALACARAHGVRLVPVPIGPEGWDVALLESTLARARPRVAYLIPDFGPSGACVPADQRAAALQAAHRSGTWLVLDETFVDLDHGGGCGSTAGGAAWGGSGRRSRILALGSVSKSVWGGLRVGWVRADPEVVQRLAAVRAGLDLASPVLEELLAERMLAHAGSLLPPRRALLAQRRDLLVDLVARLLPDWSVSRPAGGMALWATLPAPDSSRLAALAAEEGLRLAPGPLFAPDGTLERGLRLPFTLPPDDLEEALRRLMIAVSRLGRGVTTGRPPAWVA